MSFERTDTSGVSVERLLGGISSGELALADFQRDFDWSGAAIRSLIATLLMGWPAGSLLAVAGDHPELSVRPFDDGPAPAASLWMILLDGQQRLTALAGATSKGSRGLQIRLGVLESGDIDKIEEGLEVLEPMPQASLALDPADLRIPLWAAVSRRDFFSWRAITLSELTREDRDLVELRLSQVYRDHLHWLHDHEFAVITLPSTVNEVAIARIFERVNRTGLKLGSFDLVVARAYSKTWNLRERWEEARLAFPRLGHFFADDGLPALQVIALKYGQNVRQSAVLDLDADLVLEQWEPAARALDSAIEFMVSHCGVLHPDWLPYRAFPILLGAIALDETLPERAEYFRRYVVTRSFGLRFDAAANTRVVEDYARIIDGTIDAAGPPVVSERLTIGSTRQRQGAIFKAFLGLLAMRAWRNPDGTVLGGDSMVDLANVSVLPRDNETRVHLRTLGMVLAPSSEALSVARAARASAGGPQFPLEAAGWSADQLVPVDVSPRTSPQRFLRSRLDLLRAELTVEFGQTINRDLEGGGS